MEERPKNRPDRQKRQKLRPWNRPQEKEIGIIIEEPFEEPQIEVHQPIFETNYDYANNFDDQVKPFRTDPFRNKRPPYSGKTSPPRYLLTPPKSEFTSRPQFVHVETHNNDSPFDQQVKLFIQERSPIRRPQFTTRPAEVKPHIDEPLRRQRPKYEGKLQSSRSITKPINNIQ